MFRSAVLRTLRPSLTSSLISSSSSSSSFSHAFSFSSVASTQCVRSRFFSSATRPGVYGMSGKAATSIFEQAKETNALSQVSEDLSAFLSAYESSVGVRSALVNPLFKGAQRDELVKGIFDKLEINNEVSKDVLRSIIDNKQADRLKKIVADFEKLAAWDRKEVQAVVTTADALSNDQVSKLEKALKSRIDADEKLVIVQKVDPSVLGGLKVMFDSKLLDLTVQSRITQIDRNLREEA